MAHADVFSETSNSQHALERRKLSNMYAMSSLVSYEPFVDKVNGDFMDALAGHARAGRAFDLFSWMQFYAFDVIGEITLGRSFGLVEAGHDKDGLLHAIHVSSITYGSMVGLVPELNAWYIWLQNVLPIPSHWKDTQRVILSEMSARMEAGEGPDDRRDILQKCVELSNEGKVDQFTVNNVLGANIGAGSDTTGISMTAIIYFLMKHPRCLQNLRDEIDTARREGNLSDPVTFQQGQKLPYMQATIKEALRLHAAVGQILSRVVPEGGAQLAGRHFPARVSLRVTCTCGISCLHQNADCKTLQKDGRGHKRIHNPQQRTRLGERRTRVSTGTLAGEQNRACHVGSTFLSGKCFLFAPIRDTCFQSFHGMANMIL